MPHVNSSTVPDKQKKAQVRDDVRQRPQTPTQLARLRNELLVRAQRPKLRGRWMNAVFPTSAQSFYKQKNYTGLAIVRESTEKYDKLCHSFALNHESLGDIHRDSLMEMAKQIRKHPSSQIKLVARLIAGPTLKATAHPDVFHLVDFENVQSNRERTAHRNQTLKERDALKQAKMALKAALAQEAKKTVACIPLTSKERVISEKEKTELETKPEPSSEGPFVGPPPHVLALRLGLDLQPAPKPDKPKRPRLEFAPQNRDRVGKPMARDAARPPAAPSKPRYLKALTALGACLPGLTPLTGAMHSADKGSCRQRPSPPS